MIPAPSIVVFEYSFWKDYINAVVELNRCKYFSGV